MNKRITGEILYSSTPGWWVIKDIAGKKRKVASNDTWDIGEIVATVGGQIVGKAGYGKQAKIYKV